MHIKAIKEVLAQAMNKYFQVSNIIMLLKTVVPLNYQRLNYIVCVTMWSLVTVMHNCGIQFYGTVKYCSSHTY